MTRGRGAWLLGLVLPLFCLGEARAAEPDPPTAPPVVEPRLQLELTPILGTTSSASPGWVTYLVTAHNSTPDALGGRLRVSPSVLNARDEQTTLLETELWAPKAGTARLELPLYGEAARSIRVTLTDPSGTPLAAAEGTSGYDFRPLLFDLDDQGNIGALLRQSPLPGPVPAGKEPLRIHASTVLSDSATGEKLAPETSFGYSPATLVLTNAESLQALRESQQRALLGWVLAGGSLAVEVTKNSDLNARLLQQLTGGSPKAAPIAELLRDPTATADSGLELRAEPDPMMSSAIDSALSASLRGFRGGNLHPSPWGSSATFGLGEVHLLGFTPNSGLFRGSEFAQSRMLTLLAHAWMRRTHIANPLGRTPPNHYHNDAVRRELLPNGGKPWATLGAGLLLLLYALFAGPVNFRTAASSGNPLRALVRLPLWSLGTLTAVLLIGVLSRGSQKTTRHLSLLEGGAGMSVATSMSFRAFNSDTLENLVITAGAPNHVLGPIGPETEHGGRLVLDRNGLHLESIFTEPWKTVIVREDGFSSIGQGVSLQLVAGQLRAKNRLHRDLAGVIIKTADGRLFSFDRLADGAEVNVQSGVEIPVIGAPPRGTSYPLLIGAFWDRLAQASEGLPEAWDALSGIRGDQDLDWWPADVPVLLGQVVGGQGEVQDTGLVLAADRVLLRIVGYGGSL